MTPEAERSQQILDRAFARFRDENPEVARAIETMNISFSDYLQMLYAMDGGIATTTGNALTTF